EADPVVPRRRVRRRGVPGGGRSVPGRLPGRLARRARDDGPRQDRSPAGPGGPVAGGLDGTTTEPVVRGDRLVAAAGTRCASAGSVQPRPARAPPDPV